MTDPQTEAENLVDNVVETGRTALVQENEELIQEIVENFEDAEMREVNTVFSEVRRRLGDR